jgi:hypothetical protein
MAFPLPQQQQRESDELRRMIGNTQDEIVQTQGIELIRNMKAPPWAKWFPPFLR